MENRQFRLRRLKRQVYLFLPMSFLVVSLVFVGLGQFKNPFLSHFKMALIETVSPIVWVISTPIRWGKTAFWSGVEFLNTYQENNRLKAENEMLKNWRNVALQLQSEQGALKQMLRYVPPPKTTSVTARVLTDNGSRFSHSLIVSAGYANGVSKGDVAMTPNGVFGRIVEVGPHVSRLMLLTDYASRVPVVVGKEKAIGILTGDGSNMPKLISLSENQNIHPGDVVLSSGQVGVYPSGLAVGVIESVDDGDIKVRPFEENMTPNFVRLVNFGIGDVLLSDGCPMEE